MDSSALEVRVISRACAGLAALIGVTLLSTVRIPTTPAAGEGSDFSIEVVRKRDAETAYAMAHAKRAAEEDLAAAATESVADMGVGADIRLWLDGPSGEIVFVNAERYARCVAARARRMEDADCPSAADQRRMVLDARQA